MYKVLSKVQKKIQLSKNFFLTFLLYLSNYM